MGAPPILGQADASGAEVVALVVPLVAFYGLYIYAIVVCFQKGKRTFGWLGIAGLALPILDWFAIIGALRLAKPDSQWAVERYGPDKMTLARLRFGQMMDVIPPTGCPSVADRRQRSEADRRAGAGPPPALPPHPSRSRQPEGRSPAERTRDRRASTHQTPERGESPDATSAPRTMPSSTRGQERPDVTDRPPSGDIVFCPACGAKVFEDAAFCHRCGRPLAG